MKLTSKNITYVDGISGRKFVAMLKGIGFIVFPNNEEDPFSDYILAIACSEKVYQEMEELNFYASLLSISPAPNSDIRISGEDDEIDRAKMSDELKLVDDLLSDHSIKTFAHSGYRRAKKIYTILNHVTESDFKNFKVEQHEGND